MADFTIRVVLHDNASWDDYALLAEKLGECGIVDIIQSDDGLWYKLPPAEYTFSSDKDPTDVRAIVEGCAIYTGKRYAALVSASTGRYWVGLELI
jgi:hypothetical protein